MQHKQNKVRISNFENNSVANAITTLLSKLKEYQEFLFILDNGHVPLNVVYY